MEEVLLLKYGEMGLKGKNRPEFEKALETHINALLSARFKGVRLEKSRGRYYVTGGADMRSVAQALAKVPGIIGICVAIRTPNDPSVLAAGAIAMMKEATSRIRSRPLTFKVDARRSNKSFPLTSLELNHHIGGAVLSKVPGLAVDVHNPEIVLTVEVRETGTYMYWEEIKGTGGLPLGASGRGLLLISGGIDSPVAGYLAMKRGIMLDAIHFWSFPITGERSRDKVISICKVLSEFNPWMKLYIARFTDIQTAILEKCPERLRVTIMRRMMMRVASRVANKIGAQAIFTGENLGQVASQTIESLSVIEEASSLPVFRPLLCYDKVETIALARQIGTYDLSCLPYEDCCTVFVPRHPVTKPKLQQVVRGEENIDIDRLVEECVETVETVRLGALDALDPESLL